MCATVLPYVDSPHLGNLLTNSWVILVNYTKYILLCGEVVLGIWRKECLREIVANSKETVTSAF